MIALQASALLWVVEGGQRAACSWKAYEVRPGINGSCSFDFHPHSVVPCRGGVILYRTYVPVASAASGVVLHLGGAVHDVAQVPPPLDAIKHIRMS